jgi:hypothetical protein
MGEPLVTRSGDEWLRLSMRQEKRGMLIEVKAHPTVEEFMRSAGAGRKDDLDAHGRTFWQAVDPEVDEKLLIYKMDRNPPQDEDGALPSYYLNLPGQNLVYDDGRINLSFLRIAGISEGVRFISTRDVYPLQYRRELKVRIGQAFRRFCSDYIKPVTITLVMTSSEL